MNLSDADISTASEHLDPTAVLQNPPRDRLIARAGRGGVSINDRKKFVHSAHARIPYGKFPGFARMMAGYVPVEARNSAGIIPSMGRKTLAKSKLLEPKIGVLKRIDARLAAVGKKDQAASREAGLGADAIRDLRRKSKTMPRLDTLEALAPVLETTPEWLAFKVGPEDRRNPGPGGGISIIGEVAAGLWHEVDAIDEPSEQNGYIAADQRYPAEFQYGLVVRGTSINRIAKAGDVLICVDVGRSGLTARPGDLVIVQRTRGQGAEKEVTAKRFDRRGKEVRLLPDSDDPKWQESIVLGHAPDEEVSIIAIVVGTYRPLKR